ncbi:DUF6597 domain-containing transcriptional factor [Chitinophaga sp. Hz27]|uniref:DUF6597 domain-containing transcriptional factor n=1 Tax=Chitinophaga sp. Hz27 TaxID=3347169 RepID=UPI0035DB2B33
MDARIIPPILPLRPYIRYFWVLENKRIDYTEKLKLIPEGLPGLVFQENPSAFENSDKQSLPQTFIFGQATHYAELNASGTFRNIGVCFQPTALSSVFGIAASELTEKHIAVNDLIKNTINDQLLNTPVLSQKIAVLEQCFLQLTDGHHPENANIQHALLQLEQGKTLRQLQEALQISERSLERLFKHHVGISPKLYARICRFQATLKMLRNTRNTTLTEIAYLENYFDQSHFIRDFKFFAGTTPKAFLQNLHQQFPNFPDWK